ncbi:MULTISPECIES: hypothetical protein [unclassified Pseudomonas]|uniref:hypothetical protein n=1 Tax=unclassified Pseudomonas TaxID=196821 RepID=UPI00209724E3|nr:MULTISPECIES: hypothetical protein [unclassified Pseudomonas]MCO7519198.1 hypothetical protein [Pseudomonas sp. 1]MCO7540153.1 hypothetical protein [Pseudomonas sp. VA159-2]
MDDFFSASAMTILLSFILIVTAIFAYVRASRSEENENLFLKLLNPENNKEIFKLYKEFFLRSGAVSAIFFLPFFAFNLSLAKTVIQLLEGDSTTSEAQAKSNTIVGLMLIEKMQKSSLILLFLFSAVLVDLSIDKLFGLGSNGYVTILAAGLWSLILLDHKIIEYRIRKGWYGRNEFETREIIHFALSHANKDDFNDQGGLKKIVPLPEIPEPEIAPSKAWGTQA